MQGGVNKYVNDAIFHWEYEIEMEKLCNKEAHVKQPPFSLESSVGIVEYINFDAFFEGAARTQWATVGCASSQYASNLFSYYTR